MELDDILKDDKEPEKSPPAEATSEPAKEPEKQSADPVAEQITSRRKEHRKRELTAQGRDPQTGQFVPKDAQPEAEPAKEPAKEAPAAPAVAATPAAPVQPAAPAQPEFTEREKAFLRTAEEERRKRQELERRLAAPAQPAATADPAKTFWDDPEGRLKAMEQSNQQVAIQTKLQTAEMIARSRYQDFDKEMAVFSEMAQSMPWIAQQCVSAPDPAEFAYRTGKAHREMREAGGLDQLKAKIESETRARLEAEYRTKEEARVRELAAQRAALPGSLSDVRGASSPRKIEYTGPTPLADILKS